MVGSTTLFDALVGGDISEYRDQCLMAMWLLRLKWVDVVLWAPDLSVLRVIRVNRDEAEIDAFAADMVAFDRLVENLRDKLRAVRLEHGVGDDMEVFTTPDPEPTPEPPAAQPEAPKPVQAVAPTELPELF
jgi:hypothetical protein